MLPKSILENVSYGNEIKTEKEIIDACKNAKIHDYIMSLPDGYKTLIGEGGINISGGERQRLALARAFLRETPIILLDEPTSAVDSETELDIQEAIEKVYKHKTIIVIAHRLSTVVNADCIYVIKNGKIAENGKHNELMRKKGEYYRLYGKEQASKRD